MEPYIRTVHYYETDKMGITHHTNYIRWMEEARIDFLNQIGWGYDKLEAMNIFSPVTAVDCKYRRSTTFAQTVSIRTSIQEFNGVKLVIRYDIFDCAGKLVCKGHTEHCFLNDSGEILRIDRVMPELYDYLRSLIPDGTR